MTCRLAVVFVRIFYFSASFSCGDSRGVGSLAVHAFAFWGYRLLALLPWGRKAADCIIVSSIFVPAVCGTVWLFHIGVKSGGFGTLVVSGLEPGTLDCVRYIKLFC